MEKSESIKNLAIALSKFQGTIGKIGKDSNNPFFKSKYASLSTILENIQKPLTESGLCFSQMPDQTGLTSILIHSESGEYIQATYILTPVKNDPQSLGSAITYARRYALGSILGLNIDEDDDGNTASNPSNKKSLEPAKSPEPQMTEEQKNLIIKHASLVEIFPKEEREKFLLWVAKPQTFENAKITINRNESIITEKMKQPVTA